MTEAYHNIIVLHALSQRRSKVVVFKEIDYIMVIS